jgi:hypothetical protein
VTSVDGNPPNEPDATPGDSPDRDGDELLELNDEASVDDEVEVQAVGASPQTTRPPTRARPATPTTTQIRRPSTTPRPSSACAACCSVTRARASSASRAPCATNVSRPRT